MQILCLLLSSLISVTALTSRASQTTSSQVPFAKSPMQGTGDLPMRPATEAQIREFFRVSGTEAVYRSRLIESIDANRLKGEPYWPESFWDDLKKVMQDADLTGIAAPLYERHVSAEMMGEINQTLKTMSVSELASTPTGAKFCEIQQSMDAEGRQLMLAFTQREFERVYERHKPEIKAARAKYLATHPDWKD